MAHMVKVDPSKLRKLRMLNGLTCAKIAQNTGFSPKTLADMEDDVNGTMRSIRQDTVHRLAAFYGCTPADLIDPNVTAEKIYNQSPISGNTPRVVAEPQALPATMLEQRILDTGKLLFAKKDFDASNNKQFRNAMITIWNQYHENT